ncbi:MAG TPA: winged helix-turn-helix domain-containing protein [Candidatus Angelobacter sp.]
MQHKREHAIELLRQGYTQKEVARIMKVDARSVRRWKAAHQAGGQKALHAVAASGRPSKLTPPQRQRLEKQLLRGASAAGFATDLWTCPRVAEHIERTFGLRYHVDHIGRLLHAMNWSPQKPTRKAMERDEEGIRQWVKQVWPAIKKKRAG